MRALLFVCPRTKSKIMQAPPKMLIPVLTLSNFLIGVGAFIIIGMLEPLGTDLNVTPAHAGQLLTVYALAYSVLSPVLVAVTGRIGRRRVMALGLVMFALAALLSALSPSMPVLNAARVLAAAGAGLFTPVAAATAAALFPPRSAHGCWRWSFSGSAWHRCWVCLRAATSLIPLAGAGGSGALSPLPCPVS